MNEELVLFSKEHLDTLEVGSTFTSEGLFQGICDAPMVWRVKEKIPLKKGFDYTLEATYLGVLIVSYYGVLNAKGQIELEEFF